MTLVTVLLILALVCFVLAAFNIGAPVNLTALGLAFLTAVLLITNGVLA